MFFAQSSLPSSFELSAAPASPVPSSSPAPNGNTSDDERGWSTSHGWRACNAVVALAAWIFAFVAFRAVLRRRDAILGDRISSPTQSGRSAAAGGQGNYSGRNPRTPLGVSMHVSTFPTTSKSVTLQQCGAGGGAGPLVGASSAVDELAPRRIEYSAPSLHSSINSDAGADDHSASAFRPFGGGGGGGPRSSPSARYPDVDDDFLLPPDWHLVVISDQQLRFYLACACVGLALSVFSALLVMQTPVTDANDNSRVSTVMLLLAVYGEYIAVALLLDVLHRAGLPGNEEWRQRAFHAACPVLFAGFVGCLVATCFDDTVATDTIEYVDAAFAVILFAGCAYTAARIHDVSRHMRAALGILALQFCLRTVEVVPAVQNQVQHNLSTNAFFALWCLELLGPLFASFMCLHA